MEILDLKVRILNCIEWMLCNNEIFIMDREERVKERGLSSLEFLSWMLFLARALIATCSGHFYPCCLDGNFWPFKACRQVPVSHIPTCHPPLSACNSASFPFSSRRLNLCPASNNPYGVSPGDWVLSAKGCFLLIFILKIKASCWTPGCLGHRTCVSSFAAAIYLSYNDWFLYMHNNLHNICSS